MNQILKFNICLFHISTISTQGTILHQEKPTPSGIKTHSGSEPPCFLRPIKPSHREIREENQGYLLAGDGVLHPLGGGCP